MRRTKGITIYTAILTALILVTFLSFPVSAGRRKPACEIKIVNAPQSDYKVAVLSEEYHEANETYKENADELTTRLLELNDNGYTVVTDTYDICISSRWANDKYEFFCSEKLSTFKIAVLTEDNELYISNAVDKGSVTRYVFDITTSELTEYHEPVDYFYMISAFGLLLTVLLLATTLFKLFMLKLCHYSIPYNRKLILKTNAIVTATTIILYIAGSFTKISFWYILAALTCISMIVESNIYKYKIRDTDGTTDHTNNMGFALITLILNIFVIGFILVVGFWTIYTHAPDNW